MHSIDIFLAFRKIKNKNSFHVIVHNIWCGKNPQRNNCGEERRSGNFIFISSHYFIRLLSSAEKTILSSKFHLFFIRKYDILAVVPYYCVYLAASPSFPQLYLLEKRAQSSTQFMLFISTLILFKFKRIICAWHRHEEIAHLAWLRPTWVAMAHQHWNFLIMRFIYLLWTAN